MAFNGRQPGPSTFPLDPAILDARPMAAQPTTPSATSPNTENQIAGSTLLTSLATSPQIVIDAPKIPEEFPRKVFYSRKTVEKFKASGFLRYSLSVMLDLSKAPLSQLVPVDLGPEWLRTNPNNEFIRSRNQLNSTISRTKHQEPSYSMNQGGDTGQRRSRQPSSQSNFSAPQSTNERRGRQWQNQSDGLRSKQDRSRKTKQEEEEEAPEWMMTEDSSNPRDAFDMERFKEEMRRRDGLPEKELSPDEPPMPYNATPVKSKDPDFDALLAKEMDQALATPLDATPRTKTERSRFGGRFFNLDDEGDTSPRTEPALLSTPSKVPASSTTSAPPPVPADNGMNDLMALLMQQRTATMIPPTLPLEMIGQEPSMNRRSSSSFAPNVPTSVLRNISNKDKLNGSESDTKSSAESIVPSGSRPPPTADSFPPSMAGFPGMIPPFPPNMPIPPFMNLPGSEGFRPIAPDGNFPGMAPVNMNDIMRPPVNMGLDGLPMHLPPPHMLPPAFLAHLMATGRPPPLPLHPSEAGASGFPMFPPQMIPPFLPPGVVPPMAMRPPMEGSNEIPSAALKTESSGASDLSRWFSSIPVTGTAAPTNEKSNVVISGKVMTLEEIEREARKQQHH